MRVFAIYNYFERWYNQNMDTDIKKIQFNTPKGDTKVETLMETLPLPNWAWERLRYSIESFYASGTTPSQKRMDRFMRNTEVSLDGELILKPNILLHFSTGYTSVDTVCDILKNGLKCFEHNAMIYSNFGKAVNESNYVVDTWQIDSITKYSDFAMNSPRYGSGMDVDREDLQRHYAPAYSVDEHTKDYIGQMKDGLIYGFNKMPPYLQRSIDGRALQSIGFIIDGRELGEDKWLDDIYQNPILQQTFCGAALCNTKVKGRYSLLRYGENGKIDTLGKYGIASFLYGIPADQILGIVSTYAMLLSDELCKEVFYHGGSARLIVAPTGHVLHRPDETMKIDDSFNLFLENRDKFMLENFDGYERIMTDRPMCKEKGTIWARESMPSYRALFDMVKNLSSKREARDNVSATTHGDKPISSDDDTMES